MLRELNLSASLMSTDHLFKETEKPQVENQASRSRPEKYWTAPAEISKSREILYGRARPQKQLFVDGLHISEPERGVQKPSGEQNHKILKNVVPVLRKSLIINKVVF
jgi:hypothetical protein